MSEKKVAKPKNLAPILLTVGLVVGAAGGYLARSTEMTSLQSQILEISQKMGALQRQVDELRKPTYLFLFGSKSFTLINPVNHEPVLVHSVDYSIWVANHYLDSKGRVWGVGLPKTEGLVLVIDPVSLQLVKFIQTGGYINNAEVTPDGKYAFAPISGKDETWVIDTASFEVVKKLKGGLWPCDVDFTPDGKWAYIPNRNSDTVSVVDVEKLEIVKTIQFEKGSAPYMLTVSPNGKQVWVENPATRGENLKLEPTGGRKSEAVIDVATNNVLKYITLDGSPVTDEVTPDGKLVYVALIDVGQVAVIDAATLSVVKYVPVGKRPISLEPTADGKYMYAANAGSDTVSVIDTSTNAVVKTINVGKGPVGFIRLPRTR